MYKNSTSSFYKRLQYIQCQCLQNVDPVSFPSYLKKSWQYSSAYKSSKTKWLIPLNLCWCWFNFATNNKKEKGAWSKLLNWISLNRESFFPPQTLCYRQLLHIRHQFSPVVMQTSRCIALQYTNLKKSKSVNQLF